MLDLSVIIPIYNTPIDALARCFQSLETLTKVSWEAVLIDDGSTGETSTFSKDYAEKHHGFRYFWQENAGVSAARNLGLDQAWGRYVMFVDADDVLCGAPIAVGDISADLTVFDMTLTQNGTSTVWSALKTDAGTIPREVFLRQLISCKDLNSPCAKLFLKEKIDALHLRFPTDFVTGEDWYFVTEFASAAATFSYVNEPCYRYFRDADSGNSRLLRFPDRMLDNHIAIFAKKQQLIREESWDKDTEKSLERSSSIMLIEDLFNCAAGLHLNKAYTPERKQTIRDAVMKTKPVFPALPLKTWLKANTIVYFPPALWLLAQLRAIYLKLKH